MDSSSEASAWEHLPEPSVLQAVHFPAADILPQSPVFLHPLQIAYWAGFRTAPGWLYLLS